MPTLILNELDRLTQAPTPLSTIRLFPQRRADTRRRQGEDAPIRARRVSLEPSH